MTAIAPQRLATLAFMAAVTGCLLALVFEKAAGSGSVADVFVYALTAGFGLEFLIACWPLAWEPRLR